MRRLRLTILFSISFILFIGSLGLNVFAHEGAHYLTANYYDLSPEIHISTEPSDYTKNVWSANTEIAYTSYQSTNNEIVLQDVIIATAGPLMNLLIFFGLFALYKKTNHPSFKLFLISPLILSLVSVAINMYPFANSDGSIIFNYFIS